jgi:ornithine cyclodeaminase/alanine dehydrogenase-like protein (mu-crystallin family)
MKAAVLPGAPAYFAAKTNANFPGNPSRHGLPTIQGLVLLFDADDGRVLCALDSGELTLRRTAAATAVAAKYLAREDAATVLLCGCGLQGRAHLYALREVLPGIRTLMLFDADPAAARRLAVGAAAQFGLEVRIAESIAAAAAACDVCITCTPSRAPLLHAENVRTGAFVAGVGADHPEKSELAPGLLARSQVVTDLTDQCEVMGDLHHAIEAGLMTRESVHGEIGEVVAGRVPARVAADEIFVFDSTGTALQDVAAAALVYERARETGHGLEWNP